MQKPYSLRKETWEFLLKNADQAEVSKLLKDENFFGFGPILYQSGILHHPNLLKNTAIELDDEAEYLIDEIAAKELAGNSEEISLPGLGNDKTYKISRKRVIDAIKNGPLFDQINGLDNS